MIIFYLGCALLCCLVFIVILLPQINRSLFSWRLISAFVIVLPLSAILLYRYWGAENQVTAFVQQQERIAQIRHELANYKNVDEIIDKLKTHLQQQPNSAKGWYLLGRLYYTSQQFPQAVNAFSHANNLQPNEVPILLQLAMSLIAQHKKITPEALKLLHTILKLEPENQQAREILAMKKTS